MNIELFPMNLETFMWFWLCILNAWCIGHAWDENKR